MSDIITEIMIKNKAREMVKRATVKNRSDAELLQIFDKGALIDPLSDLTEPPFNLTNEENRRAIKLAQARGRANFKEIGHERGKRIAEDRDARRGIFRK